MAGGVITNGMESGGGENQSVAAFGAEIAEAEEEAEIEPDGAIRVSERLDDTAAMTKAIVQAGIDLKEIYLNAISLEDYYLGVTGGGKHHG